MPATNDSAAARYSHEDWDNLITKSIETIRYLGKAKGGEYAGDLDRLANFRRNGADVGLPMEVVWRIYAGKHWDAVTQYVQDLVTGKTRERSEPISGRVDDLMVYLLLFKAIIEERDQNPAP